MWCASDSDNIWPFLQPEQKEKAATNLAVEKGSHRSALLPYLDSTQSLMCLKFSPGGEDPGAQERSPFPFVVPGESGPLARILDASFVANKTTEMGPL